MSRLGQEGREGDSFPVVRRTRRVFTATLPVWSGNQPLIHSLCLKKSPTHPAWREDSVRTFPAQMACSGA
jgi:hypothetical protein